METVQFLKKNLNLLFKDSFFVVFSEFRVGANVCSILIDTLVVPVDARIVRFIFDSNISMVGRGRVWIDIS